MQASLCKKVHLWGQRLCAEAHLSEEEPGAELSPTLVGYRTFFSPFWDNDPYPWDWEF